MKRIILALVVGSLVLPATAGAQNCNIGGCNIVVTATGTGSVATGRTPWIDFPWTVDDASAWSGTAFWNQSGGPVGRFDWHEYGWGGAQEIHCYALHFGASTNIWLNVRAVAGRRFSCHVHVR